MPQSPIVPIVIDTLAAILGAATGTGPAEQVIRAAVAVGVTNTVLNMYRKSSSALGLDAAAALVGGYFGNGLTDTVIKGAAAVGGTEVVKHMFALSATSTRPS